MPEKATKQPKLKPHKAKHQYVMARTIKYNEIVYRKGDPVDFDKKTLKVFLLNNYVTG